MSDERTPEQIKADIAEHREELGETLEALSHKLDVPSRAKEKAGSVVQTAASKPVVMGAVASGVAMTATATALLIKQSRRK